MNDAIDKGVKVAEATGNTMQGLGRIALLLSILAVLGGGYFVYQKVTNIGQVAIDAGAAVLEDGGRAVAGTIEDAGDAATRAREATEEVLGTTLEDAGQRADDGINAAIDWIGDKRNRLDGALGKEEE